MFPFAFILATCQFSCPTPPMSYAPASPDAPIPMCSGHSESIWDHFALKRGHHTEPVFRRSFWSGERSGVGGTIGLTGAGVSYGYWLGNGFGCSVGAENWLARLRFPVCLHWYPAQGVDLSIGIDLIGLAPVSGMSLTP
jgi:hypothetical protein